MPGRQNMGVIKKKVGYNVVEREPAWVRPVSRLSLDAFFDNLGESFTFSGF